MFRTTFSFLFTRAVNCITAQSACANLNKSIKPVSSVNFSSLTQNKGIQTTLSPIIAHVKNNFLQPTTTQSCDQQRTIIKFSWRKGKRQTEKEVIKRFYRLNCGNWIRTIAGRHNKRWKKKQKRRRKNMEHVFCNSTQSHMLDKMVSRYWRRPKYYIKNPYEPYEWRENFMFTRTKPWRPEGVDYE